MEEQNRNRICSAEELQGLSETVTVRCVSQEETGDDALYWTAEIPPQYVIDHPKCDACDQKFADWTPVKDWIVVIPQSCLERNGVTSNMADLTPARRRRPDISLVEEAIRSRSRSLGRLLRKRRSPVSTAKYVESRRRTENQVEERIIQDSDRCSTKARRIDSRPSLRRVRSITSETLIVERPACLK